MAKIWEVADFRCICGKLLMKQAITNGIVELKCDRCKRVVTFSSGYQEDTETSKTAELKENYWYIKK